MTAMLLNNYKLAVHSAEIRGYLTNDVTAARICWSINIVGEDMRPQMPDDCTQELEPRFYDENLQISLDNWEELEGQEIHFDLDTSSDDQDPVLYLCSHMTLPESHIHIGARRGNSFDFSWQGLADANWDDDLGTNMPFLIEGALAFKGLEVRFGENNYPEDQVEKIARKIMDKHNFYHANLCFAGSKRFRDDKEDEYYHLMRAFFEGR